MKKGRYEVKNSSWNYSDVLVGHRWPSAWQKFWALKHIFKIETPLSLNVDEMDSYILPSLLYGTSPLKEKSKETGHLQRIIERKYIGTKPEKITGVFHR